VLRTEDGLKFLNRGVTAVRRRINQLGFVSFQTPGNGLGPFWELEPVFVRNQWLSSSNAHHFAAKFMQIRDGAMVAGLWVRGVDPGLVNPERQNWELRERGDNDYV
jgi:hypothetical protein